MCVFPKETVSGNKRYGVHNFNDQPDKYLDRYHFHPKLHEVCSTLHEIDRSLDKKLIYESQIC